MWPRLIHSIPDKYMGWLDQKNDQLSFLLNCSILSVVFGFLCLLAAGYQYYLSYLAANQIFPPLYLIKINVGQEIYIQRSILYLIGVLLSLVVAFIFNRASLYIISEYGDLIRSSYDLFRFDLLAQLRQNLPNKLDEEVMIWTNISRFFNMGETAHGLGEISYSHPGDARKKE